MFDWMRGDQEQKDKGDQAFDGSLKILYAQAESISSQVKEIETSLLNSYSSEGLSNLSRRFENISKEFTNYEKVKRHDFHEIVHRSSSRLEAVRNVAKEAKNIAQLFERYSKNPKSYSASNCRIQINRIQAELDNLKDFC